MTKKMGIITSSAAIVLLFANPGFAVAKSKKLTLEQAWALCKSELDRTIPKADHSARYSAGGACLDTAIAFEQHDRRRDNTANVCKETISDSGNLLSCF